MLFLLSSYFGSTYPSIGCTYTTQKDTDQENCFPNVFYTCFASAKKGKCHETFAFSFFSWTHFTQAPEYLLGPFEFCWRKKIVEIFAAQGAPPVSLTLVANGKNPPVSTTTVMHLDLRISPRIFEKIRNEPNVIFMVLEDDDSWKKNLKQKSPALSL